MNKIPVEVATMLLEQCSDVRMSEAEIGSIIRFVRHVSWLDANQDAQIPAIDDEDVDNWNALLEIVCRESEGVVFTLLGREYTASEAIRLVNNRGLQYDSFTRTTRTGTETLADYIMRFTTRSTESSRP